jgi:NAD(P)-dependent dehydrogenase (short-subunit alcohol dehydrogenase family)
MARGGITLNPKTILITGATDGIGKASALELARQGHRILIHGRDAARGQKVVQEIRHATRNTQIELLLADFSSLDAVRKLAAQIKERYSRLDILINNAGVFMRHRALTRDGFEMTFAVNHLAPFLLTNLLLDRITASAPARIVHVSSGTHRSGKIEWDNLLGERHYDGYDAYARSKLANVLFAYALADRLQGTQVTSNALHPGVIRTKLLHAGWGGGGSDLARGAETIVYAATAPEMENVTGRYFDNKRETASSDRSHDKQLQLDLWDASARWVELAGQ